MQHIGTTLPLLCMYCISCEICVWFASLICRRSRDPKKDWFLAASARLRFELAQLSPVEPFSSYANNVIRQIAFKKDPASIERKRQLAFQIQAAKKVRSSPYSSQPMNRTNVAHCIRSESCLVSSRRSQSCSNISKIFAGLQFGGQPRWCGLCL